MIEHAAWDLAQLRAAFEDAAPFKHVLVDGFLRATALADVRAAFDDEPAERLQDEIMDVLAGPAPPESPALRVVYDTLSSASCLAALSSVTGRSLTAVELRAYVYQPGSYLLPHADRDAVGRRQIAFALYVGSVGELEGGELDLYDVRGGMPDGAGGVVTTTVTRTILPRANRCVLFEVHPRALHRVREVTLGARLSLAGWFLQ